MRKVQSFRIPLSDDRSSLAASGHRVLHERAPPAAADRLGGLHGPSWEEGYARGGPDLGRRSEALAVLGLKERRLRCAQERRLCRGPRRVTLRGPWRGTSSKSISSSSMPCGQEPVSKVFPARRPCKERQERRGWDSNPRDDLTPPTR